MGSSPNLQYKQVPTAGQWNSFFEGKQDDLDYTPANRAGDTLSGPLGFAASTETAPSFNVPPSVAPASPNNGDVWATDTGLFVHVNGSDYNVLTSGSSGFGTDDLTDAFGQSIQTGSENLTDAFGQPIQPGNPPSSGPLSATYASLEVTGQANFAATATFNSPDDGTYRYAHATFGYSYHQWDFSQKFQPAAMTLNLYSGLTPIGGAQPCYAEANRIFSGLSINTVQAADSPNPVWNVISNVKIYTSNQRLTGGANLQGIAFQANVEKYGSDGGYILQGSVADYNSGPTSTTQSGMAPIEIGLEGQNVDDCNLGGGIYGLRAGMSIVATPIVGTAADNTATGNWVDYDPSYVNTDSHVNFHVGHALKITTQNGGASGSGGGSPTTFNADTNLDSIFDVGIRMSGNFGVPVDLSKIIYALDSLGRNSNQTAILLSLQGRIAFGEDYQFQIGRSADGSSLSIYSLTGGTPVSIASFDYQGNLTLKGTVTQNGTPK